MVSMSGRGMCSTDMFSLAAYTCTSTSLNAASARSMFCSAATIAAAVALTSSCERRTLAAHCSAASSAARRAACAADSSSSARLSTALAALVRLRASAARASAFLMSTWMASMAACLLRMVLMSARSSSSNTGLREMGYKSSSGRPSRSVVWGVPASCTNQSLPLCALCIHLSLLCITKVMPLVPVLRIPSMGICISSTCRGLPSGEEWSVKRDFQAEPSGTLPVSL
mmetsp:Transcript_14475/g.31424  ORF Transcript_14475/g.31424 Transcript_14475/m.31424 type:complete len:227 (+) Transcript_14475:3405-4085(+)